MLNVQRHSSMVDRFGFKTWDNIIHIFLVRIIYKSFKKHICRVQYQGFLIWRAHMCCFIYSCAFCYQSIKEDLQHASLHWECTHYGTLPHVTQVTTYVIYQHRFMESNATSWPWWQVAVYYYLLIMKFLIIAWRKLWVLHANSRIHT